MINRRKEAKGKPCKIRLPDGRCDGGGDTTVLAHYRLAGYNGTGMKPDDDAGAWACHSCHSGVDGVRDVISPANGKPFDKLTIRHYHAEGVIRTIQDREKE